MRFVLTWKKDPEEPSGKKAKARLVVLGFQDPHLGKENTCSPTLNRRSKQMLLQIVVQHGWQLKKGDVTAAFLQGRPLEKCKYCIAPPELAEALGMKPGEKYVKLLKSVYGLTAAPLEWYLEVDRVLRLLGGRRCLTDPCVWNFVSEGKLIGIIGAHVDDFLIAGDTNNSTWNQIEETLLASFRWTPWEVGKFRQCGVDVEQTGPHEIIQHQEEYLQSMTEVTLETKRQKELTSPVTEHERSELRALLGGLQWLVTQSRPDCAVDVNLIQSEITIATVQTLLTANKILRKLRAHGTSKLFTRKIEGEVQAIAWSDASWANRRDAHSTGGYIIGLTSDKLMKGERTHVSVVSWGTNKLKRVAKSSLAAEVQAMSIAEDELHLVRGAWAEFNGLVLNLDAPDETIRTVPGVVVIDAKSIYDTLTSQNQPLQLQEKRTAIELLAYLRNTEENGTQTRWVHGGANLADSLTKLNASTLIREFMLSSTWSVVQDESQTSGKKRKAQGLDKFQNKKEEETEELSSNLVDYGQFRTLAREKISTYWPEMFEESDLDEDF